MEKFKAAILSEQNKPLIVKNLTDQNPSKNQIKVRTISSGLCGAQVNEITGKKGPDKYLPHLMGHEGFGEVLEVGESVKKVNTGDLVILHWRPSQGELAPPVQFLDDEGISHGAGPITTFSEITIISENRCTKIDDAKKEFYDIYPLVGCAISTSYGALMKESKFNKDKRILIFGGGGLGLSLLYWTKILGIDHKPVVIDIHKEKISHIDKLGGYFCHVDDLEDLDEFDLIFETTGIPSNINTALKKSSNNAEIVLIGQTSLNQEVTFENFFKIYDGIKIISSQGGLFDPDTDIPNILKHIHENLELTKSLISHQITLDEINEGFELMKDPAAGRIVINFNN